MRGKEGMRGEGRGAVPQGWFTPHVRNREKHPDCRTELIGGGGNTDVRLTRAANNLAPPLGTCPLSFTHIKFSSRKLPAVG